MSDRRSVWVDDRDPLGMQLRKLAIQIRYGKMPRGEIATELERMARDTEKEPSRDV